MFDIWLKDVAKQRTSVLALSSLQCWLSCWYCTSLARVHKLLGAVSCISLKYMCLYSQNKPIPMTYTSSYQLFLYIYIYKILCIMWISNTYFFLRVSKKKKKFKLLQWEIHILKSKYMELFIFLKVLEIKGTHSQFT